jgi:hypothetical protein
MYSTIASTGLVSHQAAISTELAVDPCTWNMNKLLIKLVEINSGFKTTKLIRTEQKNKL